VTEVGGVLGGELVDDATGLDVMEGLDEPVTLVARESAVVLADPHVAAY
jgi:hypothetical protein